MDLSKLVFKTDCVFFDNSLLLNDLHLGRTNYKKYQFPIPEYERIEERFEKIIEWNQPTEVIINGDLFQRFDSLPEEAISTFERLNEIASLIGATVVFNKGNHDELAVSILRDDNRFNSVKFKRTYQVSEDVFAVHGHQEVSKVPDGDLIIGHLHPCIQVEGSRFNCFVFWDQTATERIDGSVLLCPAHSKFVGGRSILKRPDKEFCPILDEVSWEDGMVIVPDGEGTVRKFPSINDIRGSK